VRDAGEKLDAWTGYIPFEAMPHRADPASGTVASANQRIVGSDFAYPIYGAYSQGHRGVRIEQVFGTSPKLAVSGSVALQNDVKNTRAERNVGHILTALAGQVEGIAAPLAAWDFRYTLDSPAPTIFETFMALWNRKVQAVHLPAHLIDLTVQQTGLCISVLEGAFPDYFPGGVAAAIVETAKATLENLTSRLGADPAGWVWGRVHIAHWVHPLSSEETSKALDIGPSPVDGGSHTLRNTGGELPPHRATSGAEYRIVVDFSDTGSFRAVQNIGNSGDPDSPHYRDQFDAWLRGAYHVVHLTRAGVEADAESVTMLMPS
jgi:penicillin amidase